MYLSTLIIENFRCFGSGAQSLELHLKPGLTALVGENDMGKSAVIDALRLALGTTDQEWYQRLEPTDFHIHSSKTSNEIKVVCKFEGLNVRDKRAFVEYLTYGESGDEPVLYVNWTAEDTGKEHKGQRYRRVEVCSGKNGSGPVMDQEARDLLRTVYLRPLRDAEQALTAGRGSRLAQVLHHSDMIKTGVDYCDPNTPLCNQEVSMLGISNLVNALLEDQKAVKVARSNINRSLKCLSLWGDSLESDITVSGANAPDKTRLRELLEKLDLCVAGAGKSGLGSDNLLFMACELLLLDQEEEGNKMLLIEEPEAHLHAQRQLRVMEFLQDQADEKGIQIIVTTHSPNLASVIDLDNLVMLHNGRAFSLAKEETELESSDYQFLKRFLDVTKANLFFARGVMIVEGDAENILLPTLAKLIGRDFTEHGVSIVNVGGVGLRRYARIFKRKSVEKDGQLDIPVACLTDMDVMPDCAPAIIGKLSPEGTWPESPSGRKWKTKSDFGKDNPLSRHRYKKEARASGQCVQTFVSDEWTFEYDLALGSKNEEGVFEGGLAEDVFVAACLAAKDEEINARETKINDVENTALKEFAQLKDKVNAKDCELLACWVYAKFAKNGVSKAIAAQYLAERLLSKRDNGQLGSSDLRKRLPDYIVESIDYVTRAGDSTEIAVKQEVTAYA